MLKLRITGCSDRSMWYAGMVGQVVDLLGEDRREYLSRELAGYVNIVKKADAEVVSEHVGELSIGGILVASNLPLWLPAQSKPLGPDGVQFYGEFAVEDKSAKVQRYKDAKPRW